MATVVVGGAAGTGAATAMVLTCEEEVEACFVRCKEIYGGTTMTDSYYCSKGCASMSSEDIVNLEKYCTSLDGESTYAKCVNNCQTASANVQHVGECEYGCEYWALLPEEEPEETVTKTKASYVSKSSWNEVAFIAVLGCIIVLLLGYRRRRMRLRSGASQPYVPIKTVYNNGTEVL